MSLYRIWCVAVCLCGMCTLAWGAGIKKATLLDPTHLLVVMQEPILDSTDLSVQVTPGTVAGWKVDGPYLLITLKAPLREPAYIALRGLGPRPCNAEIAPGSWPMTPNGLAFLWESDASTNAIYEAKAKRARFFRVTSKDAATFDPIGRMLLEGGTFTAEADATAALLAACRKSGQFTLTCTVTPASIADAAGGTILSLGTYLRLEQSGKKILLTLLTSRQQEPRSLEVGTFSQVKPVQLTIAYKSGALRAYQDSALPCGEAMKGTLSGWKRGELTFGAAGWNGTLEGIAFYSRLLSGDEIVGNTGAYKKKLDARPAVPGGRPQVTVKARVTQITDEPTPKSVEPYVHALMVFEYEVLGIEAGGLPDVQVGALIRVGRWGVLQGKQTAIAREKVGDVDTLILETFADHPDLERQFTVDTLEANYELPYLYDAKKVE